jgi:hypothetical protein
MNIETQTPNPRELGEARLQATRSSGNREEWNRLWKEPAFKYPFTWGECWQQCMEYRVDDFASEVGFFADILGLPTNAASPDYFMFTSPDHAFFFAITPAEEEISTPPDTLRMQFMIGDIVGTAQELEQRGVEFEQFPAPYEEGSSMYTGTFRTPHGIRIDLWGMVEAKKERMW